MRILVFEYITGGGMRNEPLPDSLAVEGDLMLNALIADLRRRPEIQLLVPRDSRLAAPEALKGNDAAEMMFVAPGDDLDRRLPKLLQRCDAAWPIAPESNGILEGLCATVEKSGKILLNASSETVRVAASKIATSEKLRARGIAVVPTYLLKEMPESLPRGPWVVKPDDGAGCDGCRIVRRREELSRLSMTYPGLIVQPFIDGEALSLSVLFHRGTAKLLACNRQLIAVSNDCFRLDGCVVNGIKDEDGALRDLSEKIASVFPGLWGYAGVDLVRADGKTRVLEINPRLTSSYAGLSQALGINTAAAAVDMVHNGSFPNLSKRWDKSIEIIFRPKNHA